jgi:hypothetical protein
VVPVLIVLVGCAFIAGTIGEDRGHPLWHYGLAGLVFGPIGVVMALCASRTPEKEAERQKAIDDARRKLD